MGRFGRLVIYVLAAGIGGIFGLFMSGTFLDTTYSVNGIPVHTLSPERLTEMIARDPNGLKSHTSVMLGGRPTATVEGAWPQWIILASTIGLSVCFAHAAVKRERLRPQMAVMRRSAVVAIFVARLVALLIAIVQVAGLLPVLSWLSALTAVTVGMWLTAAVKLSIMLAFLGAYWALGVLHRRLMEGPQDAAGRSAAT